MYSITSKNTNCVNKFIGYVNNINELNFDKRVTRYNALQYGINVSLNKRLCIMCDESQDLDINYAKALVNIIKFSYIDIHIVGDILQSLHYENNGLKYLITNNFDNIIKKKLLKIN